MTNCRCLFLAVLTLALFSCHNRVENDQTALKADALPTDGADSWSEIIDVRDDTSTWPNGKPNGGWWVTTIHSTLLSSGKVLITGWGRRDKELCGPHGTRLNGVSFILDPDSLPAQGRTFNVNPIDEKGNPASDVLYCSGQVTIGDGRILYAGGAKYEDLGGEHQMEFGLDYGRIFEPVSSTFSRIEQKLKDGPRGQEGLVWYPTVTRMMQGDALITGGFTRCCDGQYANLSLQTFSGERYDKSLDPWTTLVTHAQGKNEMAPGLRDYTHTVVLPRPLGPDVGGGLARQLAMIGAQGKWLFFAADDGLSGNQRLQLARNGGRPDGAPGWNATSLLSPTGELMSFGGSHDGRFARCADFYNPVTGNWRSVDLGIGRDNASSVLLPDGKILIMGGETDGQNFSGDRRRPQLIDPDTLAVETLPAWANDDLERGYHNTVQLLKDGRLLVGGGISVKGGIGCERPNLRIYSPPYLRRGERPQIVTTAEPLLMSIKGAAVSLPMLGPELKAKGGAVLMALGSQTHSFDQNQRYVALDFQRQGGQLSIVPPTSTNMAPVGDYLLFLVSRLGAVSKGLHVRIQPRAADIRRTVVFVKGQTSSGQDMFLRGGIDHDYAAKNLGVNCNAENHFCAIPIHHRNLKNTSTTQWKSHDDFLDWYGNEAGQLSTANGTPADWTTNHWSFGAPVRTVAQDGFGEEPLNNLGDHNWMLDVDMDCSKTVDGWFELKSFISNGPGFEGDVAQQGTPYASKNHMARCGMISQFERGQSTAVFREFP